MPNNYSSPQLRFRIFDDELALHVDPWNTAERFSPTCVPIGYRFSFVFISYCTSSDSIKILS